MSLCGRRALIADTACGGVCAIGGTGTRAGEIDEGIGIWITSPETAPRAAGTVLDPVEQAATRFVDDCHQDEATAREQAVRGTFDPGYFAYTLGKLQIIALRDEAKRSLGDKRRHITGSQIAEIVKIYGQQIDSVTSRTFDNADFGYTRVTVERPLRLRYQMTVEDKARFLDACPHLLDDVQAIDKEGKYVL